MLHELHSLWSQYLIDLSCNLTKCEMGHFFWFRMSIAPNEPCLEEKNEEFAKIRISYEKSGLPLKNPDFQKTWIHKFSFNLQLRQYEKNNFDTLIASKRPKSRFRIVKNPDFWNFLIGIQKVFAKNKCIQKIRLMLHRMTHLWQKTSWS